MYTLEVNEKLVANLKIKVEGEEFKKVKEEVLAKYKNAKVDGFRKGHVPLDVIEKTFGEQIKGDIFNQVVNTEFLKALEEKDIEVLGPTKTLDHKYTNDMLEVEIEFEVKPVFELPKYTGLNVEVDEKELPAITEEMVDDAIKGIADRAKTYVVIKDRDEAKEGDVANINFEGFIDGEAFEGGKSENYDLVLGSNTFIEGFEKQIEGHKVGEEFDVNVVFPTEYHAENLKGKPALFKVKLNSIKEVKVPEINDELAKTQGLDNVKDLRAATKASLESQREQRLKEMKYQKIADTLVDSVEVELPEGIVKSEAEHQIAELKQQLSMQGMDLDKVIADSGEGEEKFFEGNLERTKKIVKFNLIINKIAEVEKIEVTKQELDAEFDKMASMYGMTREQIVEELKKSNLFENYTNQMASGIFMNKIKEFLISNN